MATECRKAVASQHSKRKQMSGMAAAATVEKGTGSVVEGAAAAAEAVAEVGAAEAEGGILKAMVVAAAVEWRAQTFETGWAAIKIQSWGDNGDDESRGERGGERGGRGRGGRGGRGSRGGFDGDRGDRNDRGDRGEGGGEGEEEKPRPPLYIPPDPTEDESEMFASSITTGINFDKFDNIAVKVTGENPPQPIKSFETANLRDYVLENVTKSGYKKPTPIQKYAVPIIMGKRDLMACAQTGSGKTAAFLVPIINQLLENFEDAVVENGCAQPQVVVVSPTRELTMQIFSEARKFAHSSRLKLCIAYGGTAVRHQGENIGRGCHILVATPGRLHDFVERSRISFGSIRFVVLDEADRMLDMGFMSSMEKMMDHPSMVPAGTRQTLMFSATFPEEIQHLAGKFLNNYLFVAVGVVGGASSDVEQVFYEVTRFQKKAKLCELLEESQGKRTLVFIETKRNADFIANFLSEGQYGKATSIHGDRQQREREEALADFKSGRCVVLVATAVAARGLDIKNIDQVINYDMPKSIDEYVHRIGRTGRVGNKGKAISFYDAEQDVAVSGDLAKILRQADQPVPDFLQLGVSSGYGGGGGGYGGRDVRNTGAAAASSAGNEPEEEW